MKRLGTFVLGIALALALPLAAQQVPGGHEAFNYWFAGTGQNWVASQTAQPQTILSAASNNSTLVKATPGTLLSLTWMNTAATLMDLRFYDQATAPACSSATNMVANFVVQANTVSPGATPNLGPTGLRFVNGIALCITGANANNDNSNAATGLNVVLGFQ